MIDNTLEAVPEAIDTARLPGRPSASYAPMYKMHKYWSKKPSEIIGDYIERCTHKGDVVLDPFNGYGVTALEAVRLGRRAVAIDLNPMSTFITRTILEPVNLSLLRWAFKDLELSCENRISDLFATTCPNCGGKGTVDFVVRRHEEPVRIGYTCGCKSERLFKEPDREDRRTDATCAESEIPFWYPDRVPLPTTQPERFQYVHELFTRRNLIALSTILHAIEDLDNERVRNVMKLAFSAALDKCSRLKPLSGPVDGRPTLSLGWVATRFYAPPLWQDVNPWRAFSRSFEQAYEGKKDSNTRLSRAVLGSTFDQLESGAANVLILQGSCDTVMRNELPEHGVDYVLTDPPYGSAIQYMTLSTFWGTWLHFQFDYEHEIVVDRRRNKDLADYEERMQDVFHALGRAVKPGGCIHVFYNDIKGPYLHKMLNSLQEARIQPQRIIHQPPPNSFGVAARAKETRRGYYGSYVVEGLVADESDVTPTHVSEPELHERLREAALPVLQSHWGKAEMATILHTVYGQLGAAEISAFAKHSAEKSVLNALGESARARYGMVEIPLSEEIECRSRELSENLRDAYLDASTIFVSGDRKNRVRQLTLSRFQRYGVTPEDLRPLEDDTELQAKIPDSRLRRFSELLCRFGDKLGFVSECGVNGESTIVWRRPASLECHFELGPTKVRVLSLSPGLEARQPSEWGAVSYDRAERRIWEWCEQNPEKGSDLKPVLNKLQGPSYESLTQQVNGSSRLDHLKLKVIKNKPVCDRHMRMEVKLPKTGLAIRPGQFFHLICDPGKGEGPGFPLALRRPFSIHGVQYPHFDRALLARSHEMPIEIREILDRWPSGIDFMYKTVGVGTAALAQILEGTVIDAMGPCGNWFDIGPEPAAIVVAGGIGVAPLVALVEQLRYRDRKVFVYFGAQHKELLMLGVRRRDSVVPLGFANGSADFLRVIREDFQEIGVGDIQVCTDDGSLGFKGPVTNLLSNDFIVGRLPKTGVCLYACGPHNMLRSLSRIARVYSLPCQMLLEERMACGIGACLSCVCDIIDASGKVQKKRVCKDGPVFKSTEIRWKD